MDTVTIKHKGETKTVPAAEWQTAMDDMVARLGAWVVGESNITRDSEPGITLIPAHSPATTPKANSTFSATVVDDVAAKRIAEQNDRLTAAGFDREAVNAAWFAPGTRMADVGYATQHARAKEHAAKMSAADAVAELCETITAERRRDVVVKASDIAEQLTLNGALKFDGYKLGEQAIRGMMARCPSPATGYVFGLRDRIAANVGALRFGKVNEGSDAKPDFRDMTESERGTLSALIASDKAELLDCMRYELQHVGKATPIKLRLRDGLGDIFAAVSPGYGIADAPSVLPNVLAALPSDAKATFAYDPTSTAWELRANVFTPTPVDEQAVGEAFEAYASITGRDAGNGGLGYGGGATFLRCLNASTYVADGIRGRRVHRKNVLVNLETLAQDAAAAIHVLCQAWGTAREATIPTAISDDAGKLIPLTDVIPGFYRHMLTARRGELVGILPGRVEKHVKPLALTFDSERRNASAVTRADLANGFTRYIQTEAPTVRREAEQAIGAWLVKGERVSYAAA